MGDMYQPVSKRVAFTARLPSKGFSQMVKPKSKAEYFLETCSQSDKERERLRGLSWRCKEHNHVTLNMLSYKHYPDQQLLMLSMLPTTYQEDGNF